jgi:hypothetical protein
METITTLHENATKQELLLNSIADFFDCRTIAEHLTFLEFWMEKVLNNQYHKKYVNPSDLLFFADKFINLFKACYEFMQDEALAKFEDSVTVQEDFIGGEQKILSFYPSYLGHKEIGNPLLVFRSVFGSYNIDFYTKIFNEWLTEGLSPYYVIENAKLIIPTYGHTKKLIGACWLLHERLISKNSYRPLTYKDPNVNFALSCPLLLQSEYLVNPYLMVESFFSFASLNEYRDDLTQWFKASLSEEVTYENANDLLFIHNQFQQLINAGFLIISNNVVYEPKLNYSENHQTFGHWLLAVKEGGALGDDIQILPPYFRENPMAYCREFLTLSKVKRIRYGMKEWLEAALSRNYSIATLDHEYVFDQFEDLQKIMEAMYLLIIKPALN